MTLRLELKVIPHFLRLQDYGQVREALDQDLKEFEEMIFKGLLASIRRFRELRKLPLDLRKECCQGLKLSDGLLFMRDILPIIVLLLVDVVRISTAEDLKDLEEDLEVLESVGTRPVNKVFQSGRSSLEIIEDSHTLEKQFVKLFEIFNSSCLLLQIGSTVLSPPEFRTLV